MNLISGLILFLFISLSGSILSAQDSQIDSMLIQLKAAKEDTNKLNLLSALTENIHDDAVWPIYNEKAYELALILAKSENQLISINGKRGIANALNNMGYLNNDSGNIHEAINYYTRALKIRKELNDQHGIAESYINLGIIYDNQGQIESALSYYHAALSISEQIDDKKAIALSLSNIGTVHQHQGQTKEALTYFNRSLKIRENLKDKRGIAATLNNIGLIYRKNGELLRAMAFFTRSLELREEIKNKPGMANSLINIGGVYQQQKDYVNALLKYRQALEICKEIQDMQGLAISLNSIAGVLFIQNKIKEAKLYAENSLQVAKDAGYVKNIRDSEGLLARTDSALKNYRSALAHFKQYIIFRDSIVNEETQNTIVKTQLQYEFGKKEAAAKAEQEKKDAVTKTIIYSISGGFLLVFLLVILIFRGSRQKQKANIIIHKQKMLAEEKQKDILDSIHYAKRIQQSLLPTERYLEKKLKELKIIIE